MGKYLAIAAAVCVLALAGAAGMLGTGHVFGLHLFGLTVVRAQASQAPDPAATQKLCDKSNPKPQKLNPYTGNADAITAGKALWQKVACAACHGGSGGGGMGGSLIGGTWREGGSDACVFTSIYYGRSGGMPAYGPSRLSADDVWKLMSYIRSLYTGPANQVVW